MTNDLTKALLATLRLLLCVACLGAGVHAQTFSADVATTRDGSTVRGRVYVSGGKVRIEVPGFADGFFIVDRERSAAWFIRPQLWLFMDAKQSSPLTQLLVPVDPLAPCRQWQKMEDIAAPVLTGSRGQDPRLVELGKAATGRGEWQCRLLGEEIIDGRNTLKYLAVSGRNERSYRWIDPTRTFPIRIETENGAVVVLENVVDAPQASALFEVPPEYQKFDPAQLINQIRQSDVWVEPPE